MPLKGVLEIFRKIPMTTSMVKMFSVVIERKHWTKWDSKGLIERIFPNL